MAIQMYSWPTFKQDVLSCTNCQNRQFVEIPGGHTAIFQSQTAKTEFNNFINSRYKRKSKAPDFSEALSTLHYQVVESFYSRFKTIALCIHYVN